MAISKENFRLWLTLPKKDKEILEIIKDKSGKSFNKIVDEALIIYATMIIASEEKKGD